MRLITFALLYLLIVVGLCYLDPAFSVAQICPPPAEPGYVRQTRPAGVAPNYPPDGLVGCYINIGTTAYFRKKDGTVIHVASGYRETDWSQP